MTTANSNAINLDDNVKLFQSSRSKTMPPSTLTNRKSKDYTTSSSKSNNLNSNNSINTDRLKLAKEEAFINVS